mmetsp:Transcript_9182/g.24740  ORF Transcript_9182/g.24740 Transcript_9182/m.24740 type:complete len:205 (-) Transcript_9182:18-632(-)
MRAAMVSNVLLLRVLSLCRALMDTSLACWAFLLSKRFMSSSMKHKISTSGVFVGLGLSALPLELASVVSIAATCPTDACSAWDIKKALDSASSAKTVLMNVRRVSGLSWLLVDAQMRMTLPILVSFNFTDVSRTPTSPYRASKGVIGALASVSGGAAGPFSACLSVSIFSATIFTFSLVFSLVLCDFVARKQTQQMEVRNRVQA